MMASAKEHAQAFHTWHSNRTFSSGDRQIDPWMRDVLVALQACLNELAGTIDEQDSRLDRIEGFLRRGG